MGFSSVTFHTGHLYRPDIKGLDLFIAQNRLDKIVIDFSAHGSGGAELLGQLFVLVRNSLARMTETEKEQESERYFIYLISNPRRDVKEYLIPLLGYFHVLGYLKFKKSVYNDHKQNIVRYRVVFKNKDGKTLITKRYSSLAQLSDDVGEKMTSLHYQLFKTAA